MFEIITDAIGSIDVAKHRTEGNENRSHLDAVIEKLYELRMFADNIGSCQNCCPICHQKSIENTVRTTCEIPFRPEITIESLPYDRIDIDSENADNYN